MANQLKVIGAGFGRTGTLSLKQALETLGFTRCHHMMEVAVDGRQADYWSRIARGEPQDWRQVFEGFQASTDFPSCVYYAELMEVFPDAKVVLTVRDEESWHRSVMQTIFRVWQEMPGWIRLIPRLEKLADVAEHVWQGTFHGRAQERDYAIAIYRAHNAAVRAHVPADRLLEFRVQDGWPPLCQFLGVPVPDQPFPHVNDSAEMISRLKFIKALRFVPHVLALLVVLIAWSLS